MSFVSVMETIGKGFAKGLKWAVEYAVPVERLVGLLFPAAAPVANELADATSSSDSADVDEAAAHDRYRDAGQRAS